MIHYTLLPESEIKVLKREYRVRLFIFVLFFVSCAIVLGIFSMIPAYILSFTQEKEVLTSLESLQKERKNKGTDVVVKELKQSALYIEKINKYNNNSYGFSDIVSNIILNKNSNISINSFRFSESDSTASSSQIVIIQGKALTRESLINFKNKLESDSLISNVELPVSDLAKSKDIVFSIKLNIINKK